MRITGPPVEIAERQPSRRGPIAALRDAIEAEREHWFVFLPVLFGTGAGLYFALQREPPLWAVLAIAAFAILAYAISRGSLAIVSGVLLIASAGCAVAKLRTEWVRAPVLEKRIGPVEVRGYVALVEPTVKRGQRLTLNVTAIDGLAQDLTPRRVRIRVMTPLAGIKPGEAIRLRATLAPPSAPALPAGYDFARTAWYQGLGGVGYSLSATV